MDTSAPFAERRWTSTDGLELYARDYAALGGERGLPVICLHGLTRNSRDFEDLAPLIAGWGRRVIVPDVRGRGRSAADPDPRHYQPRTYARDLAAMLDALAIPRAIFIGTSMGALITMTLAASRPGAIAGVIINDAGPIIAPEGIERIRAYAGRPDPVRNWAEAAAYARKTNGVAQPGLADSDWDRIARRLFRESPEGPVLDYDPAIAHVIGKKPPLLAGWIAKLLFKRLAKGRPLMLIRGERSDIITAAIVDQMKRLAPRMECVAIPRVGHAPMLDEPEAVDAVARFLRTMP